MKFARLGDLGAEIPVVLDGDAAYDLRPITADINGEFLAASPVARVEAALAAGELSVIAHADDLRIGAAIARPSAVFCIGQNYAAHAAESGNEPPHLPVLFLKTPNTVSGPNDTVTIPRNSVKTDWEVELGIVVGQRASYIDTDEDAAAVIAGYVVVDDLSERDFQVELSLGQWSKGKIAAGFAPVGPWLVTPDAFDPSDVRLRSFVNGEPRQDSSTADMIFSPLEIIKHLSQFTVLEPGDLICTGTPEGVALSGRFPYLAPGDVVEIAIEGLGSQRHEFAAYAG